MKLSIIVISITDSGLLKTMNHSAKKVNPRSTAEMSGVLVKLRKLWLNTLLIDVMNSLTPDSPSMINRSYT
eukprot:2700047-Amphidinium_carterae.4